jgi:hypothetical protein
VWTLMVGLREKAICTKITHTLVVWEAGERPDRSRETQSNDLEGPSLQCSRWAATKLNRVRSVRMPKPRWG